MKNRLPFVLVPWNEDFLSGLLRLALLRTEGDISRAEFIFPHSRPRRYLSLLIERHPQTPRPLIMPGMHTVSSLFARIGGRVLERPAMNAGLLDRVGLLLQCVRQTVQQDGGENLSILDDAMRFFPWGVRLAALYDECFSQRTEAFDFLHMEEEVSPFAALLLSRLGRIFSLYTEALRQKEWTTPGFDAYASAEWLVKNPLPPGIMRPGKAHPIFIAGFHTLTRTEEILFRHLWEEQGASVVLHADPALAGESAAPPSSCSGATPGASVTGASVTDASVTGANTPGSGDGKAHWSCRALSGWIKNWQAGLSLMHSAEAAPPPPQIRYVSGFDLHSQLAVLEKELAPLAGESQARPDAPDAAKAPDATHTADAPETSGTRDATHTAGTPETSGTSHTPGTPDTPEAQEAREMDAALALASPALDHQADTLVALPDSGLLMPVLHHLPKVDINISMGYPLARSPLFHLIDTLACLQENRRREGYYWRDLVRLMRHPYLSMLTDAQSSAPGTAPRTLQQALHNLESALRGRGRKYTTQTGLLALHEERALAKPTEAAPLALLREVLAVCLNGFSGLETPAALAEALERISAMLLQYGRDLWKRFPIDAECLLRLRQAVIPELARSEISAERFSPETLFSILRNLLNAERVPFDAAPLVGLQVMGMLETRLVSFRRVIVLDAVEESLPGSSPGDPLLPEALREELGLPGLHGREEIAAYTFFRLLAGAREILLLWQENPDAPGLMDQKKKKSRFVEELLWREEKKRGRLLAESGRDGPLAILESTVSPAPVRNRSITVTPTIRGLMRDVLAQPVSASLLDAYMRCPARFYYERLLGLAPAEEVREGDDPPAIGNLFHAVLKNVYTPWLGKSLPGGEALESTLYGEIMQEFFSSPDYRTLCDGLAADSRAMLTHTAKKHMADFLRNQPPTTVVALEEKLEASFNCGGQSWPLTGFIDRMDMRPATRKTEREDEAPARPATETVILDYKTGKAPNHPGLAFWTDTGFFARLAAWQPGNEGEDALLLQLASRLHSVQLPLYLLLHSLHSAATGHKQPAALEACWVVLGEHGQEVSLFPQKLSVEDRDTALSNHIPVVVHFLLRHMSECSRLAACPGQHCSWCSAAKLCKVDF